ncbi:MAG: sugar phosphate isomerase/epimerase family protein [Fimbriimonas sp.]
MQIRRPSVSTWALHPLLQTCAAGRPGNPEGRIMADGVGTLSLLEVPAALAAHGFRTMELCHFHISDPSTSYLDDLRAAIEASGVELWSTLIDDGNITDPENGNRDRDWIAEWIDRAAHLGSKCVRVIGGRNADSVPQSIAQLQILSDHAQSKGVRVLTENWFETFSVPAELNAALEAIPELGLCFDFGNWSGETKYGHLDQIADHATSCHAKCHYNGSTPDADDFQKCLEITQRHQFAGPYTLVYGEAGRVWETLDEQRALLAPYL